MRLTYLQKLGRGWGILIDLILVFVHGEILLFLAFLPCFLIAWGGSFFCDSLSQGLMFFMALVGMAYGLFVGPVVLFNLVKFCGLPWRFAKDPTRAEKAERTEALTGAEPTRAAEQELPSFNPPSES